MADDWEKLAKVYARMGAPMRPSPEDAGRINAIIAGHDADVLLLGVTPEYSVIGKTLTAVDNSASMIAKTWPGDDERRRVLFGDWLNLPFDDGAFTAAVGDGVLTAVAEGLPALFAELRRVIAPGGLCAFRAFCAPEAPETFADIAADYFARPDPNPSSLRMRIAMTLAAEAPDYVFPVAKMLAKFNEMFPDRIRLAEETGWSADAIASADVLEDAKYSVGYSPRSYLRELAGRHFDHVEIIENEDYPMAERCPIMVLR